MNYQEMARVSEQVISVPAREDVQYDFEDPAINTMLLLEILAELKEMNAQLKHGVTVYTDDSISVYVTNHLDI